MYIRMYTCYRRPSRQLSSILKEKTKISTGGGGDLQAELNIHTEPLTLIMEEDTTVLSYADHM